MTTQRASCWSVTINNPTEADEEQINLARQRGWRVDGQLERGSEGTPHYQLRITTPQIRFSAMKKAFPRGHIEAARDAVALGRYVTKEATRVAELPTGQSAYPSLSKLWELIYLHYNTEDREGWDYFRLDEGHANFYGDEQERTFKNTPLVVFDNAARALIMQGYHVEAICGNPATRSMWKLFARELVVRSHKLVVARALADLETDRQTDSVVSAPEITLAMSIPDANEEQARPPSSPSDPSPAPHPSAA